MLSQSPEFPWQMLLCKQATQNLYEPFSIYDISALLEFEPLECELRLDDAGGLDPGPEHVLLRGHVVRAADAVEGVEIVGRAVVELRGHNSVESWHTFQPICSTTRCLTILYRFN